MKVCTNPVIYKSKNIDIFVLSRPTNMNVHKPATNIMRTCLICFILVVSTQCTSMGVAIQ